MADRILRTSEVTALTGKSRTSIWRDERAGTFPRRRQIGAGIVGWLESEVEAWIQERPLASVGAAGGSRNDDPPRAA